MKFLYEYMVVIMLVNTLGPKGICRSSYALI
jgi:hypothetical protein